MLKLNCFKETTEFCGLQDNIFETQSTRLELSALRFQLVSLLLHLRAVSEQDIRAIPLLPLWAFVACSKVNSTFTFQSDNS